jgi:hypothetical protein
MERLIPDPDIPPARAGVPLTHRLEEVERENRRLRRLSVLILIGVGILLGLTTAVMVVAARHGMPGMVPQLAEARKYLLRDPEGRVRGTWGINEEGAAQLILQDSTGRGRLRMSVLPDGSSGLAFVDSANHTRLVVGLLPDESANIVLADKGGRTRTVLGIAPNGSATLVFADRGGATRAGLGVDPNGFGTFNLIERPGSQFEEQPAQPEADSLADPGSSAPTRR